MTRPLDVLRQAAARPVGWVLPAKGRHRRPVLLPDEPVPAHDGPVRREVLDEVSLEELLPPWPKAERPLGAVVVQRFGDCPTCGQATAGISTKDGWLCGECFTPATTGGLS